MGKVKKILYIDATLSFGGSVSSLSYLLWNLDRSRYEPALIAATNFEFWRVPEHKILLKVVPFRHITDSPQIRRLVKKTESIFGIIRRKLISLALYSLDVAFYIFPYSIRLWLASKGQKIDLIHLNNRIYRNAGGIFLAKYLGVPCIVHYRGFEYHNFIVKRLAKLVDHYIAISEATKKDLLELGVYEDRITVIPEGIDLAEYSPDRDISELREEFHIKEGSMSFGIVGCLAHWKGHPVFLKAAKTVLEEFPDCKVFIIGGGDEVYQKELEKLAQDLNIADRTSFTGYRRDIADFMLMLDVVVHASTDPEPFGRVIIEAMAMKKPVIATRLGAPVEIIKDGKNGFLVPPGDHVELAKAVVGLLKNKDRIGAIGEEARRTVVENFSIQKHTHSAEKVYENLLTKKIKVAHIIYGLRTGGLEKMVISLLSKLDKKRFEPIVCCISSHSELENKLKKQNIKVYFLNRKDDAVAPFLPLSLSSILKREKVKVVHTHNYAGYLYGVSAAILARTPQVVHTQHGRSSARKTRDGFVRKILDWKVNKTIVVADVLRGQLGTRSEVCRDKIITVPNGINDEFSNINFNKTAVRKEFGFKEDDKLIGTVARLDPVKNMQMLIRGFSGVRAREKNVKLIIVGDGADGPNLKKLAKDLKIENDVFFLGTRSDVPEILSMFDIFVLTSEWESMSLALVEAMAASLPVVATSVGGNPELVQHMENGILVPADDVNKLAEAMSILLKDNILNKKMGISARKFFEEKYTLDRMVSVYEGIYDKS